MLTGAMSFGNRIVRNYSVGNGVVPAGYDLAETAAMCLNTWTENTFVTKNRACIS